MYISILSFLKELHSGKKVVDTLAKTAQQIHSFIIPFCLSAVTPPPPPTPESMLFVVNSGGSKIQHQFWGKAWEYKWGGERYVHYAKTGHFIEVSQYICPSLYFAKL